MERIFKVMTSKELSSNEKLILIMFLINPVTLGETNRYIGDSLGITGVTVSTSIMRLAAEGYIKLHYNSSGISRNIVINEDKI